MSNYTEYVAPRMLQIVGGLLEIPRETRADANFASVVSNNRLAQEAYLESLVVEGAFLVSFLILWFLYLIVMKCQGDEVGCASGRKFYPIVDEEEMDTERYTIESDTDESFLSRSQSFSRRSLMSRNNSSFRRQGSLQDVCGSSVGGASCELYLDDEEEDSFGNGNGNSTSNRSLVKPVMATHLSPGSPPSSPNSEKGTTVTPASTRSISRRKDPTMVDESREPEYLARLHIHAVHTDMVQRNAEDEMNNTRCWFCSDHPFRVQVRRRRTRFAFALFGLLSLVSCGLLLTGGAYEPLRSASFKALEATDDGVLVLDEIRYHMNTLRDSSWVAQDVIENNLPLDLSVICPDIPPQQFSTSFGVDTQDVILFIEAEFDNFVTLALENIDQVNEASNNVRSVLVEVNRTIHEVEDRMWLFPFLVSCISILTIIQLYAVARATWWKTLARNDGNSSLLMGAGGGGGSIRSLTSSSTSSKSKSCFRRSISWIVIPLLLLLIVIGWGLTIGLAFSTVITSDICTTGDSSEGTPEQTIRQILKRQGYAENSTEFERVTSYTEGCQGDDPIAELRELQSTLDERLDYMRELVTQANDIGFDFMKSQCGTQNQIETFFAGVVTLEHHLNVASMAMSKSIDAVSCPTVHELYSSFIDDALCTDYATASSGGFVFMFTTCILGLVMITLRAAWA